MSNLIPCPLCDGRPRANYCQTCRDRLEDLSRWADTERAKRADMTGPREAWQAMAAAGRRYRAGIACGEVDA